MRWQEAPIAVDCAFSSGFIQGFTKPIVDNSMPEVEISHPPSTCYPFHDAAACHKKDHHRLTAGGCQITH